MADFFENNRQEMIKLETLLTSHIAIAPEGGGDGETEKCDALEKYLIEKGFKNIEKFEAPDSRVSSGKRPSLVVTIPGKDNSQNIWVMAHIDVVPTGEIKLWNSNPWEVFEKDGKIIGRGVEDNQQGLCSAVLAGLYYLEKNIIPSKTIKLLFVADEENGSKYGINWLLENTNLFKKNDLFIIPDGGDSKGETIEIAEKNILWLKFCVLGKQTHGSRPDNGANACLAASALILELHSLEKIFNAKDELFEPNYSTFQPTKREKNVDCTNIIPGEDCFYMDCRILPQYKLSDVLKKVDELCRKIEKDYKVKIEYSTPQYSESPATSKDSEVAQKLAEALKKVHNIEAKFIGIGGGTVAAELRRKGYSAVVWSTLDDQAHQPNEYCILDNLLKDAKTLVELFK